MTWKHILAGLCGFSLGFWFCTSRDIVLLPRYEVLVLNASGRGLPSAYVKELRQDFAITGATSSSLTAADTYGRAAFPPVHGHTSPLHRLILCGQLMKAHGIHTPCGYLHQITAEVPGYTESSRTETALPLNRGYLLQLTMRPTSP